MLKVGLILYSVREEMAKDPIATVRKVAALGYKNIEVCNHNAMEESGVWISNSRPDAAGDLR